MQKETLRLLEESGEVYLPVGGDGQGESGALESGDGNDADQLESDGAD